LVATENFPNSWETPHFGKSALRGGLGREELFKRKKIHSVCKICIRKK